MKCWDIWKEFVFYAGDFVQFAQKWYGNQEEIKAKRKR